MSLHVLADHMAAKGRGPDSMLVHMTPGEVASLQKLATANGTSLTINPETGLPEAFKLKDLLPAVAGAALNYFAPGVGTAIGGALGLSGAAGAGIAIGGITSLATGSLSRGLMAGLGAYGGAGLGSTLGGAGMGALAAGDLAAQQAAGTFPTLAEGASAEQVAKYAADVTAARDAALSKAGGAGFMDQASAGLKQIAQNPAMYGKDLLQYGMAATSPIAAGAMVPTTTGLPSSAPSDAYIRPKRFDPYTQTYEDRAPVKASEWGSRSFNDGGIVALADGGLTMEQIRNQYAASGGSPNYTPYTPLSLAEMNAKYTNTGGSKQAYDYLMNKGASTLVPSTPTGEIMRPYNQAVLGMPVDTSSQKYVFDPITRTYKLNPNYNPPKTGADKTVEDKAAADKAAADKAGMATIGAQPSSGDTGGNSGSSFGGPSTPAASPYNGLQVDWTGVDWNAAKTGLMVGGIPGALLGGIGGGFNVQTTSPATGPGTIGSRDNRGSNESSGYSAADAAANAVAMQSMGDALAADQAAAAGLGGPPGGDSDGYGGATSVGTGMDYSGDYASPGSDFGGYGGYDSGSYGGDSGGYGGDSGGSDSGGGDSGGGDSGGGDSGGGDSGGGSDGGSDGGADGGGGGWAYGGAVPGYALGGLGSLGGYSDGGRLLRGPGDGVSDDIPAVIGDKQPARLADGEFVVPARIVSELGNGSTEAGARKLYAMMDRIQANRKKSVGKTKVAVNSRSEKHLPA